MLSTVKLILLASSVAAYPWVGEVAAGREVEQRDLAGFLESMALAGDDITHSLDGIIKAANDAKMKQLGGEIKKGVDWIIETANNTPGWPGWPVPSNLNLTAKDITKDLMYATFKLDRSAKPIFPAAEEGHPHVPPGPNDQRGPCPGLNTLANHGYIPHNGIVTPSQLVRAVWEGLSMGPDLGAILAIGGFVFKGDLDTMQMSIGGEVEGAGVGLSQHGIIEGDGSVTRMDSTLGDHIKASQERLKIYYDEIRKFGTDGYDINPTVCAESRYRAYMDSYNNNPSFDFNPNRHLIAYAESGFAMGEHLKQYIELTEQRSSVAPTSPAPLRPSSTSSARSSSLPDGTVATSPSPRLR